MGILDFVLILFLFGFIWFSFWRGFIYALGSLVGLIIGAFLASRWYVGVAGWAEPIWAGHIEVGYIISFIILLIIISSVIGIIFQIIDKFFQIFTIIPGLEMINRLLGAILGFLVGTFAIGLIILFITRFPLLPGLEDALTNSKIVLYFTSVSGWLNSLFPETVKNLESILL